jgi:hypothetical protein
MDESVRLSVNNTNKGGVKARLCNYPEPYKYSSARFYFTGKNDWDFLVHLDGRERVLVGEEYQQGREWW